MKITNINLNVPSGARIDANIPEGTDDALADTLFRAILGGLTAIYNVEDEASQRAFLIRYVSAIVAETNSLVHSCQLSNDFSGEKSPEKIVEDLLKSLHKKE